MKITIPYPGGTYTAIGSLPAILAHLLSSCPASGKLIDAAKMASQTAAKAAKNHTTNIKEGYLYVLQ